MIRRSPFGATASALAALVLSGCAAAAGPSRGTDSMRPLVYPKFPTSDVVDDYHGTKVPDPWRWLEDETGARTREFVAAQNALAQPRLEALAERAWFEQRLTKLWNYERFGVPIRKGGRYFYLRNDGSQNQSVLHVADALDGPGRVLVDPNAKSQDATIAMSRWVPSPDGSLLAYALSDGGTDWEIWRFRRVADGQDLPDTLRFTKFWSLSWARDGSGVYYSRYPQRPDTPADARGDDQAQPVVYFHRLGEAQERDREIYRVADHPRRAPSAEVTEDGAWLVVTLFDGYQLNGIDVIDLRVPGSKPQRLFDRWDALYTVIGSEGDTFYVQTTNAAPLGCIVAVDASRPQPEYWRTVVPQGEFALAESSYVGGRIIASYVRDARSHVEVWSREGAKLGEVPLPGLGTVTGFPSDAKDPETFFAYADYLRPGQIWRYDAARNQVRIWHAPNIASDVSPYVTRQVFFASRDGTRVSMFLTHRRDLARDGEQPVMLYGYGGFNISLTPSFRPANLAWIEAGGIYAEVNLRGGGEYGDAWHSAGTKLRKQNVFDDFIAAAEYLIRERYTRPAKLAISGRSNGGLLVGAAMTQRPDLFGAALPGVGVLDMLRYHTASANARQWSSDYGLSEVPEEFRALAAYSPVHNVRAGTCYPATLVTTADRDDRVVPWHSYKFAAALQAAQACDRPILLRVETRAGHGAGKPVWMQIEDFADQLGFAAHAIGLKPPAAPDAVANAASASSTPPPLR